GSRRCVVAVSRERFVRMWRGQSSVVLSTRVARNHQPSCGKVISTASGEPIEAGWSGGAPSAQPPDVASVQHQAQAWSASSVPSPATTTVGGSPSTSPSSASSGVAAHPAATSSAAAARSRPTLMTGVWRHRCVCGADPRSLEPPGRGRWPGSSVRRIPAGHEDGASGGHRDARLLGAAPRPRRAPPPGQTLVSDWPVLTAGPTPHVPTEEWSLTIRDETGTEHRWSWDELLALGVEDVTVDIHCVTHWSRLRMSWRGVSLDRL